MAKTTTKQRSQMTKRQQRAQRQTPQRASAPAPAKRKWRTALKGVVGLFVETKPAPQQAAQRITRQQQSPQRGRARQAHSQGQPASQSTPSQQLPQNQPSPASSQSSDGGLVGRVTELKKICEWAVKKRHVLLVGAVGIGKTHMLAHLMDLLPNTIIIERLTPLKPALLEALKQLKDRKSLRVAGMDTDYLEWTEIAKKLSRLTVGDLTKVVTENLKSKGYILLLDGMERLTPSSVAVVEQLLEVCLVVGATRTLTPGREKLWWGFQQVELPPLSREDAKTLLWQLVDASKVKDAALFETKVLSAANGNPLAIKQMAEQIANEPEVTQQVIRDLHHPAGVRYIDLTFGLLLIGAGTIAARFVALGLNDTDLYIIAGVSSAAFIGLRFLIGYARRK